MKSVSHTWIDRARRGISLATCAAALASALVPASAQTLANISSRASVGTNADILIAGFNISGTASKTVLVRAVGPTLTSFGLGGALADPKLEIYNAAGTKVADNDSWSASDSTTFASVGAFALTSGSKDAALVTTLPPGGYTAQVSGVGGTAGVGLVEVYDVSGGTSQLLNLSTRAQVGTGANVLINGFVLSSGGGTRMLLVRAAGPSLSGFSLTGLLADPKLEIYDASGAKLAENDNWATPTSSSTATATELANAFTKAGAFSFSNTASKDSAMLLSLPAGSYTAQVSGVGSTTGLAIVELYDVTAAGVTFTTTAPGIATQPAAQSVSTGGSATLSVVASGTAPLKYQWFKAGAAISGATSASYTIGSATTASAGSYHVVVTNSAGSVTSSSATLTVTTATTGSNTAAAVAAAQAFLATLSATQQATTQLTWTLATARKWSNLPTGGVPRNGIGWGTLSTTQKTAATALLDTVLSATGQKLREGEQAADDYLSANGGGSGYGAALYYFSILGTPSTTDFWAVQFSGHHLTYNFTFNGRYKSGTPLFLGVEPRTTFTVSGVTYDPMLAHRTAVGDLFTALPAYADAKLSGTYSDLLFGANGTGNIDGTYPKAYPTGTTGRGALYTSLSAADQEKVKTLVHSYVDTQAADVANELLATYLSDAALAQTYVAFAGTGSVTTTNSYLRVDGPRVWIEFSVQGGIVIRNEPHYHSMWRDKLGDYGGNF